MQLRELTFQRFEERAAELGVRLPIEQTEAWARLEETIDGRSHWGCFEVTDEGSTVALVSLTDLLTHGYHYLRANHAPVWVDEAGRTPERERELLGALSSYVRRRDGRQLFVRLAVAAELPETSPTLSGVPYDRTVVIDLSGGGDEILARMKPRGRRDVRKALREAPVTCADETELASVSFEEYYEVMRETAERDGFAPAPLSDYQDMVRILGPAHCRVFAGRDETGAVVTWSMVTVAGTRATRYYAGSRSGRALKNATDKLLYFECCELSRQGCADYDLMGIGSEFSPSIMGLNEFKTKFCKGVVEVAPDRDLPLRPRLYGALQGLQAWRRSRREAAEARAERQRSERPREDLLPVLLGGDVSVYAYAREFHEAYHVRSVAMNTGFVGALAHSRLVDLVRVPSTSPADLREAISRLAKESPRRRLPVVASTDALVAALEEIRDELPENVVLPIPSREAFRRACDKAEFSRACEALGLRTPRTEVVSLAGDGPVPPCAIAFPVVAKPARSAEYSHLYARGLKKVYCASGQAELDALWARLRAEGFSGDFLVQELIGGDDTHLGACTFYVGADGAMRAFGFARTLLEDHAPTMRGNAVAMLCQDDPGLRESCERLVTELGYTGLGEVDVKRDPATGEWVFLELNPRVGRNSYHMVAGGVNPMRAMVDDLVDGRRAGAGPLVAGERALYTLVPLPLLRRYLAGDLLAEVDELAAAGRVFDPQRYDADRGLRRMLDVELTEANQHRKFARHYPRPTETSF